MTGIRTLVRKDEMSDTGGNSIEADNLRLFLFIDKIS
jgi:hypothetical protein